MSLIRRITGKLTPFGNNKNVKILVVEVGDFTEPDRATALLWANLSREKFRDRPDVWRWNGAEGGIDDRNAYVLLETGRDVVTPKAMLRGRESHRGILFQVADEDVLFDVADGKPVVDFRDISDYLDLRTFTPSFTGDSARERYYWISKVAALGHAAAALEKNKFRSFLEKYWGFLFFVLAVIVSSAILLL